MAHARRYQLTPSPEWWKHLRKFNKRRFWKRERRAQKLRAGEAGERHRSVAVLAALLAVLAAGCVTHVAHPGEARKVLVCHKGQTIEVAAPALDAHLRHGDHRGPCR